MQASKYLYCPLGASCPQHTILLSDLVGYDSPLQIVMTVWHTFLIFHARQIAIVVCCNLPHPTQQVQSSPNDHYYLQRAVTPHRMRSTDLWRHTFERFFKGQRNLEGITRRYFLMSMKGLSLNWVWAEFSTFFPSTQLILKCAEGC